MKSAVGRRLKALFFPLVHTLLEQAFKRGEAENRILLITKCNSDTGTLDFLSILLSKKNKLRKTNLSLILQTLQEINNV